VVQSIGRGVQLQYLFAGRKRIDQFDLAIKGKRGKPYGFGVKGGTRCMGKGKSD